MKKTLGILGTAILVAACGGMEAEDGATLQTKLRTPDFNSSVTQVTNNVIRFAQVPENWTLVVDLNVADSRNQVLLHGDELELRVKDGRIEVVVDGRVLTGLNAVVGADYKVRIVSTEGGTNLFVNEMLTDRMRTRALAPAGLEIAPRWPNPAKIINKVDLFRRTLRADVDNWERINQLHRINEGKLYIRVQRAPLDDVDKEAPNIDSLFLGGNINNQDQVSCKDC